MTRNPHLTDAGREALIGAISDRVMETVRIRLGCNVLATTKPGEPIRLSGREAEEAARAALAVLDERAFLEVWHYAPTQDAYDAACRDLEAQRERADAAEQHADVAQREVERLYRELSRARAAHATPTSREPLDVLRAAVKAEPGPWTSQRAQAALESTTVLLRGPEARRLLNQLADEGLLVSPGARGRIWTRPEEERDG